MASKELIFTFVTYLIGKESPYYQDTLSKACENWDMGRSTISNPLPIIELIYSIYKYSNDTTNLPQITLSERDLKCLSHPAFLKLIYKNSLNIFCELIIDMNKGNYEFTKTSCFEITNFIDDISVYDENETFKLVNCILKILDIEDEHQMLRFNILLGYPQLIVEEPNQKSNVALFGYNLLSENKNKYTEIRGLYNVRNSCCLMKKIFSRRFKEKTIIEIFLKFLNASKNNLLLLKYIRNFNSEETISQE